MLCYLHPELLAGLAAGWLVGVVTSHVGVIDLERLLDSLRVEIEDTVKNDLSLLYLVNSFFIVYPLLRVHRFVFFSLKLLNFPSTDINCIVDLEEYRLALLFVRLFSF